MSITFNWRDIFDLNRSKTKKTYEMLDTVNEGYSSLIDSIDKFNGVVFKPINKDSLEEFPLFEWIYLDGDTKRVKVQRRKMLFGDHYNFDTIMEAGGAFGRHFHGDMIESCEVISGRMKDLKDGKVYNSGDVMHYEKNQTHTPIALEKSKLRVIFKP